ncbi:hypothetical protein STEG23_027569 [Scotinomys teguina]
MNDEYKLCPFYEENSATEEAADAMGEEWNGYVALINAGLLELSLVFGCGFLHLLPSVTGERLYDDRVFTDLITGPLYTPKTPNTEGQYRWALCFLSVILKMSSMELFVLLMLMSSCRRMMEKVPVFVLPLFKDMYDSV